MNAARRISSRGDLPRRALLIAPFLARVLSGQDNRDDWQDVERVVAVGDIHGDCDALVAVLKMAGVVDDHADWAGGKAHVVQVGDLPSRGPQTRKAMDLLMKLETQAAAAGGGVHALIGNHEAMVMSGDYRSILPEEFAEFKTPESAELLKALFEQEIAERRKHGNLPRDARAAEEFRRQWFAYHTPGFAEYKQALGPNGQYGTWIRSHNAVVLVNGILYSHGGISPKFVSLPVSVMNRTIRTELADPSKFTAGMITDFDSPLWYRGLAEGDEREFARHVDATLRTYGVKRIAVGHTVTRSAIMPRFGSRVVNIDIGLSRFYGRPPACLVSESGSDFVLHNGSRIPLPDGSKGGLIDYFERVAKADSQPELIRKAFEKLRSAAVAR